VLTLVGVNHVSAPLAFRERLAFPEDALAEALRRLLADGFEEGMILSTCNRVEVLVRTSEPDSAPQRVRAFLERERGVDRHEIERQGYQFVGGDAARHVFSVASGLDSMILGEPQILGQVKTAYLAAREAGTTGPMIDHLLQQGLAVAKKVRTDTGISRHAVSIAFAAVELARKIFERLEGRTALLLGAGKMAELAARHLASHGVRIIVASRTYNRAAHLAQHLAGEPVAWESAFDRLWQVDVVVSGTAAAEIVLPVAQVRSAMARRRGKPLFVVDLAVPRDVDPAVNDLDGVYLYDLDDLQGVVAGNLAERARAAEVARVTIDSEVAAFVAWRAAREVAPAIVALRETLEELGRREIERFRARLGGLTPEQERAVEEMTRSLVQKVLHRPIQHLKASAQHGDVEAQVRLLRELFGVRDDEAKETKTEGGA
jgi:glutamyl-tRNA reductase